MTVNFQSPPRYDWWQHGFSATVASWGGGGGVARTATPPAVPAIVPQTQAGQRMILHAIKPLANAAGTLTLFHGDGVTPYLNAAWTTPTNFNGEGNALDLYLTDGLAILGGTNGSWLISYALL